MNRNQTLYLLVLGSFLSALISCQGKTKGTAGKSIDAIDLKRGDIVRCGPPVQQFGLVGFETSCPANVKKDFDLGVALLHSFEYDEAEKVFAKVIDEAPECAMAYWGVAMSNFHPLWAPPTPPELEKGARVIEIAKSLPGSSKRETAYINAISVFYKDWNKTDHITRSLNFEKAMENLHTQYPDDKETAIFYALALNGAADPTDKTFSKQKKAVNILNNVYPGETDHPGIVHYTIHSYDYPELAELALPAARKYASIAPSSAHARHMPSHIFTRLGLWDEQIKSNLASFAAAKCYADSTGIKGHWDEEMHVIDYLVYAYLQQGDNIKAKELVDYMNTITVVSPENFKVAYSFAAVPARYVLENKMWKEAAVLSTHPANFPWEKYPWQKAITHFVRLLGSVHTGQLDAARSELKKLATIHDTLTNQKDVYKAGQVLIQMKAGEAWILLKEGNNDEALKLMQAATDMEEKTSKHPVTPGEVFPARELLADMLLQLNQPAKALESYEIDLKNHRNRFNGLYGAAQAAEKSNQPAKAKQYYEQLVVNSNSNNSNRPELVAARRFLKK